jgi:hypothetical protein
MLLRDRLYAPYSVIVVFDGLTESTIDRFPDAVAAFLASPAGHPLRRTTPTGPDLDRRRSALRPAVVRMPEGTSLRDLIVAASAAPARALPVSIVASGNALAVRAPHAAMDGRGAMEFCRFVVDTAAGGSASLDRRARPRLPYVRMLARHLRFDSMRAYRSEQAEAVPGPVARIPSLDDLALRTASFDTFVLSDDEVERLRALERRGSSSSARLGALAIRTLRRVYRGTEDLPVQIPVDLRRWAPAGRIDGNFISVAPLGSLVATDWSAPELGRRLRDAIKAKTPIIRSLHAMLWHLSRAPERAAGGMLHRAAGPGRLGVSVSMLVDPTDYVDAAWVPGADRRVGAATIGPWPSSTFVSIVQSATRVRMTVWDETGLFDTARFRDALREELNGSTAPATRRT